MVEGSCGKMGDSHDSLEEWGRGGTEGESNGVDRGTL